MTIMFARQRAINIANLLNEIIRELIEHRGQVLKSNVLVIALDKRDMNTWLPWNRYIENQGTYCDFKSLRGLDPSVSPFGSNCTFGDISFEHYLDRLHNFMAGDNINLTNLKKYLEISK